MWRSGGSKPESVSHNPPAPRSRLRGPFRLLIVMAVLFITTVFIFPLTFEPSVDPPNNLIFASPFSLPLRISNHNVTPLRDVEYNCVASKLTLANGSDVTNARILTRSFIREIPSRRAFTAHCEAGYIVNTPLKAAEYKLTLTYRAYPWPQLRTRVYVIAARMNAQGEVTAWKVQ
jgi:hypothetical protein